MRLITRTPRTCRCPIEMVELLDGQHLQQCSANRIGEDLHLAPHPDRQPPHQVEGIPMPWTWMPTLAPTLESSASDNRPQRRPTHDIDIRWCDISTDGEGRLIARRWPQLRLCAAALRVDGLWSWWVWDLTADQDEGEKHIVARGVDDTVGLVAIAVDIYLDDLRTRQNSATSLTVLNLRNEA